VSGAENGAERAEKLVSVSGAVSGTAEKREERERSAEREIGERERSVFKGRLNYRSPFGLTNNFSANQYHVFPECLLS
jgi:hypothetical protein